MSDPTPIEIARQLDDWGFNVLPARVRGKSPQVSWQKYQNSRTTDRLDVLFGGAKPRNYWIVCGRISRVVVLDCDSEAAIDYWRERIGDVLDQTTCVKTSKGAHFYFRIAERDRVDSWSMHDEETGVEFDVRAEGTGVIVPPSIHESGHEYVWLRGPESMVGLPEALRGKEELKNTNTRASTTFSELVNRPPSKGGRNNWLAQVAGHLARQHYPHQDAYETTVGLALSKLVDPLPEDEARKTIDSIWRAEHDKRQSETQEATEDNGYLVSAGYKLLTTVKVKRGKQWEVDFAPWADFDISALGVVEDENVPRVYDVEIRRNKRQDSIRTLLPARELSDPRRLRAWLAERGVSILAPDNMTPRTGDKSDRLTRFLESQDPPHFQVVNMLGGDPFITHDGVITTSGLQPFAGVKPNPSLQRENRAPHRYGFAEVDTAQSVLREVLTFHDETVCAVFGSWWAACMLKPQIMKLVSMFPFVALEAPSESGKTTGFFSLMMQLNGNTRGQSELTRAALRDAIAAHHSGIVWIDDMSDVSFVLDLLRQATGEGSVGKKGEDRHTTEEVRLVSPIVLSGESLQIHGQKALLDRALTIKVPSPTSRRSLKDPERLQWDDIVELKNRYPDLTQMAGTLVQLALRNQDVLESLQDLRSEAGGRFADKIAIVRMGARLLDRLVDDKIYADQVDTWCEEQESIGSENALTLEVIPRLLAATGWPSFPSHHERERQPTPVFVQDDEIWFSPDACAHWWSEIHRGRVETRTHSVSALRDQAHAMRLGRGQERAGTKQFRLADPTGSRTNKKVYYWRIPRDLSDLLIRRSQGKARDETTDTDGVRQATGVHPEQYRLLDSSRRPDDQMSRGWS